MGEGPVDGAIAGTRAKLKLSCKCIRAHAGCVGASENLKKRMSGDPVATKFFKKFILVSVSKFAVLVGVECEEGIEFSFGEKGGCWVAGPP